MKHILVLAPLVLLLAGYWFFGQPADAAPNVKITLTAGESALVLRNGCVLQVTKNTVSQVKVKCTTSTATEDTTIVEAVNDTVTLNAGQRANIVASNCQLAVVRNKPAKVKVKCNAGTNPTPTPTDTPDETVTVGPGGNFSYSSSNITINVGDTVEWLWASNFHTVTSGNGTPNGLFCSPNDTNCSTAPSSNTGAKYRHKFDTAGTFQYYCRVHGSGMSGVVNVNP